MQIFSFQTIIIEDAVSLLTKLFMEIVSQTDFINEILITFTRNLYI